MMRTRKATTFGKLRKLRTLDRSRVEYRINLIDGNYISIRLESFELREMRTGVEKSIPYYVISNSFDDRIIKAIRWTKAVSWVWSEARRIDSI